MRINEDSDSDTEAAARDGAISSMGAYLEAMRGEDGHTRDAKGKAKFNKTQGKRARGEGGEEEDVPVTEGLRELDIEKGKRNKKQKRETVQIGGEFKAKVRCRSLSLVPFLLRRARLTFFPSLPPFRPTIARRRRRQEEGWYGSLRLRSPLQRCGQEERQGSQDWHHWLEEAGQGEERVERVEVHRRWWERSNDTSVLL